MTKLEELGIKFFQELAVNLKKHASLFQKMITPNEDINIFNKDAIDYQLSFNELRRSIIVISDHAIYLEKVKDAYDSLMKELKIFDPEHKTEFYERDEDGNYREAN